MKHPVLKLLFVCLLSLLLLAGCGEGESEVKVETVPLEGWQSFTIIRPDTADGTTTDAAVVLRKAIEEATGVTMELGTDWVKRGQEPPAGTAEILVGATNRAESDTGLAYNDFTVSYTGGRVVINGGGSGESITQAIEWFTANCITDGQLVVPAEPYVYTTEYPLSDASIAGTPLSDYVVRYNPTEASQERLASDLAIWLANRTGVYNKPVTGDTDGHMIKLSSSDEISFLNIGTRVEGGNILLMVNPGGASISQAIDLFCERVEAAGNTAVTTLGDDVSVAGDNYQLCTAEQLAEWRKLTDERIENILSTPNMEIPANKVVYYVSPNGSDANDGKSPETAWKTLDKVNSAALAVGNYVCFERGGIWRGQIQAKAGVTYTAYGEGDKPTLYGSPEDGTGEDKWLKTDTEGIWKFYKTFDIDMGVIVFNHGEAHGIKVVLRKGSDGVQYNDTRKVVFNDYRDLAIDLEYYQDNGGAIYIRSDENPGVRYESIEFAPRQNGFAVKGNGVTIDNFCIKYVGAHGVGAGSVKDLIVQNCEIGWIGGGIQHMNNNADGTFSTTRFGNGVEIYGGCDNYQVLDCYFYQIYDAAITHQYKLTDGTTTKNYDMKNVVYRGNVTEYCNYSIEYFLDLNGDENPSRMENILMEDNYLWYAGLGFCEQRPNLNAGAHIKGWHHRNRATNFVIKDNLMIDSRDYYVHIWSSQLNPDGSESMPEFTGNVIAGRIGSNLGYFGQNQGEMVPFDLQAESYMDGYGKDNSFYFIEEENWQPVQSQVSMTEE
ncbi:MAG: right-handed parallel beta-helix repeat-containing protein [Clostridia bacterium]|nr:right-handed parallel beta-helix repeat-containing protein [Clostridia bacterium]